MALGVDSASNRNEYQEYFFRSKGGRCVGLTSLPPSFAIVLKSRILILLEPSGSVQACNGIALPLPTCFPMLFSCSLYSATKVNSAASLYAPSTPYLAYSPRSLMLNVSTHSAQSLRSVGAVQIETFSVQCVCVFRLLVFGQRNFHAEGWERVSGIAIPTADWRTQQDKYPPLAT